MTLALLPNTAIGCLVVEWKKAYHVLLGRDKRGRRKKRRTETL